MDIKQGLVETIPVSAQRRKGTDCPQKTRKFRFNSFCVVVAVVDLI